MSDAAGGQKNQPELLGLFFRDVRIAAVAILKHSPHFPKTTVSVCQVVFARTSCK
jgi:hypothetical protein